MAHTRHDYVRGRLASNREWLDSVLARITSDMLTWAPAEGMRTIASQLVEIISVELVLVPQLRDGKQLTEKETDAIIGNVADFENLRAKLESTRQTTLEYLDSLSAEELAREVSFGDIWFGSYWEDAMPRAEIFVNIAEHEFYHVGQLIAYLWSRGDDPYKW
jgi:uncharacterized damage-inducible protein DinB